MQLGQNLQHVAKQLGPGGSGCAARDRGTRRVGEALDLAAPLVQARMGTTQPGGVSAEAELLACGTLEFLLLEAPGFVHVIDPCTGDTRS